jgi:hypothetical protein
MKCIIKYKDFIFLLIYAILMGIVCGLLIKFGYLPPIGPEFRLIL